MTVEQLINTLTDMLAEQAVRPDSQITIAVESVSGSGCEAMADYVTSLSFGKYAVLYCYRPLLLETDPSRRMGYQDFIQKVTGERPAYVQEPK